MEYSKAFVAQGRSCSKGRQSSHDQTPKGDEFLRTRSPKGSQLRISYFCKGGLVCGNKKIKKPIVVSKITSDIDMIKHQTFFGFV